MNPQPLLQTTGWFSYEASDRRHQSLKSGRPRTARRRTQFTVTFLPAEERITAVSVRVESHHYHRQTQGPTQLHQSLLLFRDGVRLVLLLVHLNHQYVIMTLDLYYAIKVRVVMFGFGSENVNSAVYLPFYLTFPHFS